MDLWKPGEHLRGEWHVHVDAKLHPVSSGPPRLPFFLKQTWTSQLCSQQDFLGLLIKLGQWKELDDQVRVCIRIWDPLIKVILQD